MPTLKSITLRSAFDGLPLDALLLTPDVPPAGVVQLSHGMAEHKERYLPLMQALAAQGLVCFIHDHRGHGGSVRQSPEDLGHFYDATGSAVVQDLYQATTFLRARYASLPLTLLAHSMGTLIARIYLQTHDDAIQRLVLCGAPGHQAAAGLGISLVRAIGRLKGDHYRSGLVQKLLFGAYSSYIPDAASPMAWLSANEENVRQYEQDPLCGFTFTCNGFGSLFSLSKNAFSRDGWQMKNPSLPIHMVAGDHDPVIGGVRGWQYSQRFLYERGYTNLSSKLYKDLRHELLLEKESPLIIRDLCAFIFAQRA